MRNRMQNPKIKMIEFIVSTGSSSQKEVSLRL
jgi:hypothetical protein